MATQKRILVVDDTPENVRLVAMLLKKFGYVVSYALNGHNTLEYVKKHHFDLILLDVMMPGLSGYEVCEKLKQNRNSRDIPVIFLTARNDSESITKAFKAGGVDYITKPFNAEELQVRINTHLKIKEQREELAQANAAKDKFFSIIAHDLRSPLGNITGLTELIRISVENRRLDEVDSLLNMITKAAQDGTALLENLLDWARLQTGHIVYQPEEFKVNDLIEEARVFAQSSASRKNIKLVYTKTEELVTCSGDVNMLQTVLRNFLTNSIKFTPREGQVEIGARAADKKVEIFVKDSGIGMTPEQIGSLFDISHKNKTAGTMGEKGTGLGLHLCREFVELHNSKINISSEPYKGSRFTFVLPRV